MLRGEILEINKNISYGRGYVRFYFFLVCQEHSEGKILNNRYTKGILEKPLHGHNR